MIARLAIMTALALAGHAGPAVPAGVAEPCPAPGSVPPRPCGLEVVGGEDRWRASQAFSLRWRNPTRDGLPPVAAVRYRVLDEGGRVVREEERIPEPVETVGVLVVPPVPAAYTAEVRLEDAAGEVGPAATAELRFDDARPPAVELAPVPAFVGAASIPLRLGLTSTGAPPVSGIRGYALSTDERPGGDPCAASDRCADAEVDFPVGAASALWIPELPEGDRFIHVASVSGSGMKSGIAHLPLRVDLTAPTTTLTGAGGGWANGPVTLAATAVDRAAGMAPFSGGPAPFTAIRVDGGVPAIAFGKRVEATVAAPGVHTVSHYARDAAGNVDDGSLARPTTRPPATATVRIDTAPPRVHFARWQDPQDPEAIVAHVEDPLSGPSPSRGRIEVRPASGGGRYEPLPTDVAAGRLSARWDSGAVRPGRYEFRAVGYDAAGNSASSSERAGGSRMTLTAPLKQPASIMAELTPAATPVRPGSRPRLSGRLLAGRRAPLGGVPVTIEERFAAGSRLRERHTTVHADASGKFVLRLAAGPSRSVVAEFAGTRTISAARTEPLPLAMRAAVRMRASAKAARIGGRPVVFGGSVVAPGAAIPAEGKYVELQFRLPGLGWSEFRTVRTDRRGRFRYAYRFSDDDSRGVRFQFRAYAPAQDDWPYEPAGSRPVAVRGR